MGRGVGTRHAGGRYVSGAARIGLAVLGGALAFAGALAGEAALDADLLEFLGTLDTEGQGWSEYLAHTDVNRAVRAPAATPPAAQPQQPPQERQVQKP